MEDLKPHILTKENFSSLGKDISLYPNGIIVPVNKPYQHTSTEVVGRLKYFFKRHFSDKKLKVGHAGTLDPLATGVLLVCVGKATKLSEQLQSKPKEYVTQFVLGATTPSFDREHPISQLFEYKHITRDMIDRVVSSMQGVQEQVPPIFSAKMVEGRRLYSLARKGEDIELKSSKIEIYSAQVLECNLNGTAFPLQAPLEAPSFVSEGKEDNFTIKKRGKAKTDEDSLSLLPFQELFKLPSVVLRILCSKGTYIRSIARDFGLALSSGAFMNALCRTRSGEFSLEQTLNPEDFE